MKYRPSNGSEGMMFMARYCDRCERDRAFQESDGAEDGCAILAGTMAYAVDDPEYPEEWFINDGSGVICTAFCPENASPIDAQPEPPRQCEGQLIFEEVI